MYINKKVNLLLRIIRKENIFQFSVRDSWKIRYTDVGFLCKPGPGNSKFRD